VDIDLQEEILRKSKKRISAGNYEQMENPLTMVELETALRSLPNGKSPGLDGLPKIFYLTFWPELKDLFLELTNEIFLTESLAEGQETASV
jgi:hypothetical protein